MTVLELRQIIAAALSSAGVVLGTYTYPEGSATITTPALWVDDGKPQAGLEADGLEVVIYLNPSPTIIPTFQKVRILRGYTCVIKNWDSASGVTESAIRAICSALEIRPRDLRFMPASSETTEMATFSIADR